MNAPLTGIIPPLVTPLKDRDTLDAAGLERVIEHVLAGGVHGLFLLGTTGEAASLSYRLRREMISAACAQVKRRVPVLVGITDTSFVESVNLARHCADCGADAVVLAPPYHMPEGQAELREYLGHLLPELPLPLFLYNVPPLTKVAFALETVRWAMGQPRILGMKDSSGSMIYFNRVQAMLAARRGATGHCSSVRRSCSFSRSYLADTAACAVARTFFRSSTWRCTPPRSVAIYSARANCTAW